MAMNIRDVSEVGMEVLGGFGPPILLTFFNGSQNAWSQWSEEFVLLFSLIK